MRLIDADALLDEAMDRYCKECEKRKSIKNGEYRIIYDIGEAPCRACEIDDMKAELEDAPSIDAVPVVRCKECKHLLQNDRIAPNWWRICDYWRTGVDENEYCSHGERKEE